MNPRSFVLGLVVGIAATASIVAFRPKPPPAPAPSPDPAAKLAEAQRTAEGLATENVDLRKRHAETAGHVAKLEASVKAAEERERAAKETPPATPAKPAEGEAKAAADMAKVRQRMSIQVGKPLPDDIAGALELEPAQRAALDALMAAEGKELYAALREIAKEDPKAQAGDEDGPQVLIAALQKGMGADLQKFQELFKDEQVANGTKQVYLDEIFGPASTWVKIAERLDAIRGRTMESAGSILRTDGQRAMLRDLLERNFSFGGAHFSLPKNVLPRKP